MRALVTLAPLVVAGCAGTGQVAKDGSLNGYDIQQADDSTVIDSMTSPVYEVELERAEIIVQAETCANRHLSVGSVATSGGSEPLFDYGSESGTVQGGSVVQQVSPEQGVLAVRGRTDYRHAMIGHSAESTMLVEAKDGRFRIVHSNIRSLQKSTGSARQDGFNEVHQRWGTGWDNTLTALQDMSAEVSECIQSPTSDDW